MKNLKSIYISCIAVFLMACGQSSNSKKLTEEEVNIRFDQSHTSTIMAQVDQIAQTKLLFKEAYLGVDKTSKINNELLSLAGRQAFILDAVFKSMGTSLSQEIQHVDQGGKSLLNIQAIDGLCVSNKFIIKYLKTSDSEKISESKKELAQDALKIQPEIEKTLKDNHEPLENSICTTLN